MSTHFEKDVAGIPTTIIKDENGEVKCFPFNAFLIKEYIDFTSGKKDNEEE